MPPKFLFTNSRSKLSYRPCFLIPLRKHQNQFGNWHFLIDFLLGNYDYLEENGITSAIKYATYERETKRNFKKKTFNAENWKYDAKQKAYTCPYGNPVPYKMTETKKNGSGYEQTVDVYQCNNCEDCPLPPVKCAQNQNTAERFKETKIGSPRK